MSLLQARSSEDSKDPNVGTAHERTRRLVVGTNTENVPDSSQTRSFHESIRFNVGDETLRDRTVQPVVNRNDSSHEQTMLNEGDMDFRIPGLPHSVVKHAQSTSVRELIQKIENRQLKKKCKKKQFQGIHDRFLQDQEFRIRMIEHRDEELCRRWDALVDEDHTCHLSEEEYFYYKNKWWLHINKSGSDTQPLRKRSYFKQALSTLERLHQEAGEEQLAPTPCWKNKQWKSASSSSSTWWQWQESWWSS